MNKKFDEQQKVIEKLSQGQANAAEEEKKEEPIVYVDKDDRPEPEAEFTTTLNAFV